MGVPWKGIAKIDRKSDSRDPGGLIQYNIEFFLMITK